ncbi:Tol-Pal system-associated acyl-CoA thioesterase [hydrothermal vent metagenome]|uniref:Tol-Pal system-associated acyl-CoA thioesterase n=1 Tax=hydrothermal vent metagenome TaxID=652676 RepID=A0A3B0ZIW1_9ZZZZ
MGEGLSQFYWPVRIYYEDTDSGGVVYYANYLKFMERARTEYLRSLGFEQDRLRLEQGVLFAVRSVQVDYRQPAWFNDALEISAQVNTVRRTSLIFNQRIMRCEAGDLVCEGQIRIACVDAGTFKPSPIPETLRSELLNAS